jgi:S-adenosylmethionine decarboxylase proenzyme
MSDLCLGNQVGIHLLVNVYDVPDNARLEFLEIGRPLLDRIVRELQLNVVSRAGHQFTPTGYSYAYVLSESHFTIHTYPEYKSCYIDIFCCNPEFPPYRAIQLIQHAFDTSEVRYQIISR